jgi:uncharacterized protein involved in exopolysaccharide biosynthesis
MGEILKYFQIVRKWWWVIVLLFVATVGTMLVISFMAEPEYEAKVTVQVSAPPPQETPLYSQFGWQALYDEIEQNRSTFKELLVEGDVVRYVLESLPDINLHEQELRENRMVVDAPDKSQILHITVRYSDPETAAQLANTIVEVGLQRFSEFRAKPTASTREFIERQLQASAQDLEAAEAELSQFQIDNKIGGTLTTAMGYQYDIMRALKIERGLALADGDTVKAQAIDNIILDYEADLQNLIGLSSEYNALVSRVDRLRENYNFLVERRTEAQIKENQIREVNFIQVITPARPPNEPVVIIDNKIMILGVVGSIIAGVLLTFLLEYVEVSSNAYNLKQGFGSRPELVPVPDNVT